MFTRATRGVLAMLAIVGLALAVQACGGSSQPTGLRGFQPDTADDVGGIALPGVTSRGATGDLAMTADPGALLLVYFGYTSCPDVCPTTMSDIKQALKRLGSSAERVEVAPGANLEARARATRSNMVR